MDRPWLKQGVAIVGAAGRFPRSDGVAQFFDNLLEGRECIERFSRQDLLASGVPAELLSDPFHVPAGGVLRDIDAFDANFFGMGRREAQVTDPQDRAFMQTGWHALEDAGCDPRRFDGSIGVFASKSQSTYLFGVRKPGLALGSREIYDALLGNDKDYVATRFSYAVGLTGPSVSVQTACSSSLVAVHMAVQSLLAGECDLALAGGVTIRVPQKTGYLFEEGGAYSPDGHCRPYERRAQGTVSSEGVAVVVLQRAEDALERGCRVDAVIRGSAINNDGRGKIGFTAPSAEGQYRVITEALEVAELRSADIGFVEGHGTGTRLGDAIELEALNRAFGTPRGEKCILGSLKSQMGHLDAAAGVAGLLKAALVVKSGKVPPTLHFSQPNEALSHSAAPFAVTPSAVAFPGGGSLRRAGVSAFGVGGTNSHIVVEQGWDARRRSSEGRGAFVDVLALSARSEASMEAMCDAYHRHLAATDVGHRDICWTSRQCRTAFEHRIAVVAESPREAAAALQSRDPLRVCSGHAGRERSVAFLFPGAGAQYPGMGRGMYDAEPDYRSALDECLELARRHTSIALGDLLLSRGEDDRARSAQLEMPSAALPALFMVQYSLAKAWMARGVRPEAMLGQSLGEYTAACVAGVLSLEDALALTIERGRLVDTLPEGAMLRVAAGADGLAKHLPETVDVAVVVGSDCCILSGPVEAIARAEQGLQQRFFCQRLKVRGAGHSRMVEPIMSALRERVRHLRMSTPQIPYVSNLTAQWVTEERKLDAEYWVAQLRRPVLLGQSIDLLARRSDLLALELGPGSSLGKLLVAAGGGSAVAVSSMRHPKDERSDAWVWQRALAQAWSHGCSIDWRAEADREATPVCLPRYPFEKVRHWSQPHVSQAAAAGSGTRSGDEDDSAERAQTLADAGRAPAPQASGGNALQCRVLDAFRDFLGVSNAQLDHDFFALGGTSLMAVQLASALRRTLGVPVDPRALLSRRTARALADHLAGAPEGCSKPPSEPTGGGEHVIVMQAGEPAMFPWLSLIHPVGGQVFHYRDLISNLGSQWPVQAFTSPGLRERESPLDSIADLARHHLGALLRRQPRGPFLLAGNSLGGMIAFEMACQLERAGATVRFLGLLDTPGPEHMPKGLDTEAEVLFYIFGELMGVLLDLEELKAVARPFEYIKGRAMREGTILGLEEDEAMRLVRVFQAHARAARGYLPPRYGGRVTFFRAERRRRWDPEHPEFAWTCSAPSVEVVQTGGDHITMLEPPHVHDLAVALSSRLEMATPQERAAAE